MTALVSLLAVTVAFPPAGQTLPPVPRTWMSGAGARGLTRIAVQGRDVEVYRTGAWLTMVDLAPGENTIEIVAGSERTNVTLRVAAPPPAQTNAPAAAPQPRKWTKLPYAADAPRPSPAGVARAGRLVVVDAGHGGPKDRGAVSPHGIYEKDANLALARAMERELANRGFSVLMTRTNDTALVLTERAREACERDAAAFVSLHHNSTGHATDPRAVRHFCVYYWNDLGQGLAAAIERRAAAVVTNEVPSKGVLAANYAVTRNPQIPSCLVEADFIVTPEGEAAIFDVSRRMRLAAAIAQGVEDYLDAGP